MPDLVGESRVVKRLDGPSWALQVWGGRLLELASGRQKKAGLPGLRLVWCAECAPLNGVQVGGGGSGALGEGRVREGARCVV